MELKYILDEYGNFALFSPVNTHRDMARGFYKKPISAGFCTISHTTETEFKVNVTCYGKSVSLNLESRPGDETIINDKLNDKEY